jgi:hypothetical protein
MTGVICNFTGMKFEPLNEMGDFEVGETASVVSVALLAVA